jgi:hypothetical protein
MALNVGTLVGGAIRPINSLDLISTAYANEIKGGIHGYATLAERDSIIIERRQWGMLVTVYDDDISASNNKTYQLKYDNVNTDLMDPLNWIEYTGASSTNISEWQNSVKSISTTKPTSPNDGDRYLVGIDQSSTITGFPWQGNIGGFISEYNAATTNWTNTYPTDGMTVRVDDQDNSLYKYEGTYSTGIWNKEKLTQVYSTSFTGDGVNYTTTTSPQFISYESDTIFLSKFDVTNTSTIVKVNINGLGLLDVKKPSANGIIDLYPGEIQPDNIYSLTYDQVNNCFQFFRNYSNDAFNIKYYIEPADYIVVPPYCQYWVYGDLIVDGTIVNYGQVIVANGELIIGTSGVVQNFGDVDLITIGGGSNTSNFITVTKSELDDLITNSLLQDGATYKITGVHPDLYDDGTTSGTTIFLKALTNNKLSIEGSGLFYNPKYNQSVDEFGIWSNRSTWNATLSSGTFSANEAVTANNGAIGTLFTNLEANIFISGGGSWSTATSITGDSSGATASIDTIVLKSYDIDDTVIWGGYTWINLNGNVGDSLDSLTLDSEWDKVPYDLINYNLTLDIIHYDYENDTIVYREDIASNIVQTTKEFNDLNNEPIQLFQWGNNFKYGNDEGIGNNLVQNSICDNVNFSGQYFIDNILINNSEFYSTFTSGSYFASNTLNNSSLSNNSVSGGGYFYNNTLSGSSISSNSLSGGSSISSNSLIWSSFSSNSLISSSDFISNILNDTNTFANILINNSYFSSNLLNSSGFENNTLDSSEFSMNTLNSTSKFIYNKLTGGANFNYNTLSSGSLFDSNTLGTASSLQFNTLSNSSYFSDNTLNVSSFVNNSLSSSSYFNNNTLIGSNFNNNSLTNESHFNDNTLSSNASFYSNSISSGGQFAQNTLNESQIGYNMVGGGNLFSNTLISSSNFTYNTINSSQISYNSLSGSATFYSNILSSSGFISNTLGTASNFGDNLLIGSTLTSTTQLVNKTIQKLTMENGVVNEDISAATIIFQDFSRTIYKRPDGTSKIKYYNNSDVLVVTNINA